MSGQKQDKGKGFVSGGPPDDGAGGSGDGVMKQREAAKKLLAKAEEVVRTNHIVYGANDVDLELEGHSIAEVEEALAEVLNMEPGTAECYVEGELVKDKMNFILQAGQRVEFMKEAGQKG